MGNPREPIEHAFNFRRLDAFFAVGAVLMLIFFAVAVIQDNTREWKGVQARWYDLERETTQTAIQAAEAKVNATAAEAVTKKIADAEARIAQNEKDLGALQAESRELDAKYYKSDQKVRFTKALIGSAKYEYEEAAKHGEKGAPEKLAHLNERNEELAHANLDLQDLQAKLAEVASKIEGITGDRDAALKERDALYADRDRGVRKLAGIEKNVLNDVLRNAPLLDFMAPFYKINQIVVDDAHNDINFLTIPRVDRCTTCHVGIDKKGYENAEQPFRTHPNLDLFVGANSPHPMDLYGCTICHAGRDRGTSMTMAAHTPSDEEEEHHWKEKYGWEHLHYWEHPMLRSDLVESSCSSCHAGTVEVPKADKLNQGTHLIETVGCTGCHKIAGRENLPKAGPSLQGIAGKTTPEWTFKWIKDPKAFRPTTRMPRFFDLENTSDPHSLLRNNVETAALVTYLFDVSKPVDLEPMPAGMAGDPRRGEKLVTDVGCRGCHLMDGEEHDPSQRYRIFGPPLVGLGSKTTPRWVYNWVRDPKRVMPTTRMPNLRLTQQEALDITAYLTGLTRPEFADAPVPAPDDTLRDAVLFEFLKVTLPDREAREKLEGLTAREKDHLLGEKLIARYGCFGCHLIEGFETAKGIGTELTEEGSKPIKRFDFGFIDIPVTREDWIRTKLENPRIFDRGKVKDPQEKLKMPDFGFTDEEAHAVTLGVLSLRKRNIVRAKERLLSDKDVAAEKGWRVIRNQNCRGCHQIEGEGGDFLALVEDKGLGPPILAGEGDRVQAGWLFDFLKAPTPIRPWLSVRMPTFEFADTTASDLVRGFQATAPKGGGFEEVRPAVETASVIAEGKEIFESYKCLSCHQLGEATAGRDPADLAPDLALAPKRLRPGWVIDWLRDPQVLMPDTRMPSFFYSEGQAMFDDADHQITAVQSYIMTLGGGASR